ncbi:Serine/threonine-protein kinase CBK1 [Vitis vinifera]|uniref:non-specific serine/threonine protein kinase n=1 Tax=Vitis vinifera TaxID=29760 RepID=A0A438IV08_VITVI|nr:Serine/threonine-protein kinase CBK1 [Vitis vinifera]
MHILWRVGDVHLLPSKVEAKLALVFLSLFEGESVWRNSEVPTGSYQSQHLGTTNAVQIVNWRTHLKFPEEAKLSAEAKDLISRLLCNVAHRLGTKGAHEIKAHPWFKGIQWESLYQMEAAFVPEVNDELDTQNFEKFEELGTTGQSSSRSGPWKKMLPSKDVNFVGYTYKNFEIVNEHHVPGIAELKKKTNKPRRPSIKTLFDTPDPPDQPVQGSFINLLPTQVEVSESPEQSPQSNRPPKYPQRPMQR